MPANPRAWPISAGRFKAINGMRRRARYDTSLAGASARLAPVRPVHASSGHRGGAGRGAERRRNGLAQIAGRYDV